MIVNPTPWPPLLLLALGTALVCSLPVLFIVLLGPTVINMMEAFS